MDLGKMDIRGAFSKLELRGPNDEKLKTEEGEPIWIELLSEESSEYMKKHHALVTKRLSRSVRKGRVKIKSEELEEDNMDKMVACTKSWGNIVVDNEELLCTSENAMNLYERFKWIRVQVDEYIHDAGNFIKN